MVGMEDDPPLWDFGNFARAKMLVVQKSQTTTWDVKNTVNHRVNYQA